MEEINTYKESVNMKEYQSPSVISGGEGGRAIPALIAGVSLAKAFAAGAAIALGASLFKKDITDAELPGLEPCID